VLSYADVSIARLNAQIRRIRILVVEVFADSPVSQDGIPQLLAFLLLQLAYTHVALAYRPLDSTDADVAMRRRSSRIFVPEQARLYVATPAAGTASARILVYQVR
jgi:hypothetical protein